jgi:hypothetical protein
VPPVLPVEDKPDPEVLVSVLESGLLLLEPLAEPGLLLPVSTSLSLSESLAALLLLPLDELLPDELDSELLFPLDDVDDSEFEFPDPEEDELLAAYTIIVVAVILLVTN